MGTYTDLTIGDYAVLTTEGGVSWEAMTVFRESDKRVFKRNIHNYAEVPWQTPDEDPDVEVACVYSNTARHVRQRLDVMGFSFRRMQAELRSGISTMTRGIREMLEPFDEGEYSSELNAKMMLLEEASFDDWMNSFRYILDNRLSIHFWDHPSADHPPLVRLMLDHNEEEGDPLYCFPVGDVRYLLRVFVEVAEDEATVKQDVTALVHEGIFSSGDELCTIAAKTLIANTPFDSKIIILTEGTTDKHALELSLEVLYPHLSGYFAFIDFDSSNLAGGASSLAATVKAFVGSGITNRIVAIFDNDTAAWVARKGLAKTKLPDNIIDIAYPELELARDYPAIGPNGLSRMDINGLACSIELYFGTDTLTVDGQLTPIHWKGYDESVKKYQGEINNKKGLQDAFFRKARDCVADRTLIEGQDWASMRLVWQHIFRVLT